MAHNSPITGLASSPAGTSSFRQLEQGGSVLKSGEGKPLGIDEPQQGSEFAGLLQDFMGDVNHLQSRSGDALKAFVGGEITDLHQVMIAGQEAGIALDLMIEIRNRVMESFQEIMRMQV